MNSSNSKIFLLLSILTFLFINLNGQVVDYVVAYGKLKVEWGNTENTLITLYEDGEEIDDFAPEKNGKFQFSLELNHVYMFWFEKPGHVTKKVQFDTKVAESVTSDPEFIPFPDFDFNVTLFETYHDVDTMFFENPVGKIQYSASANDFDWDKDYTLEIQRSMEKIETEIREKHEQKLKDDDENERLAEQQDIKEEQDRKEAERIAKQQAIKDKEAKKEKERLAKQKVADDKKKNEEAEKLAKQKADNEENERIAPMFVIEKVSNSIC